MDSLISQKCDWLGVTLCCFSVPFIFLSSVYMQASATTQRAFDSVYHTALRLISNQKHLTHHCDLYSAVGWSSLTLRRLKLSHPDLAFYSLCWLGRSVTRVGYLGYCMSMLAWYGSQSEAAVYRCRWLGIIFRQPFPPLCFVGSCFLVSCLWVRHLLHVSFAVYCFVSFI